MNWVSYSCNPYEILESLQSDESVAPIIREIQRMRGSCKSYKSDESVVHFSMSIRTRLHYQHESIHELIEGWSEEKLKVRRIPDKWSPFENIVHLVAYQPTFIQRIKVIITEDGPSFDRYKAENDPLFYHFLKRPMHHIMDDLDFDRVTIVNTLSKLDEEQLRRIGYHPKYGAMTLGKWTEFFLLHEAHHLYTIFMLIQDDRGYV